MSQCVVALAYFFAWHWLLKALAY